MGLINLEFNEYQEKANRTLYGNEQVLTNCALGLAGEAGQLIYLIKDYTFKGKELDRDKMIHEMGDVLWYLSNGIIISKHKEKLDELFEEKYIDNQPHAHC